MNPIAIALEIGGTKLQVALGTPEGEILARNRGQADTSEGAMSILRWFDASIPSMLEHARALGSSVTGIGVGFGGPVETASGRVLVSHQVGGWSGFPLQKHFEGKFNLPTTVANDANVSGWAEFCRGAGRGTRTFCYMNIGSGIGGAFVIDGKLFDGQGLGAAEIGHTYVPDWTSSAPGTWIKLERLCSGWAIERRLRESADLRPATALHALCGGDPARITCPMLGRAAAEGDDFAVHELDRTAQSLAVALSNVIALIHPERIALGGGVSLLGDVLLNPLRKHVNAICFEPYRGRFDIVPCELGEDVVLVGGLLIAPRG
jgi:glucokinase